mmetsp:Transcript_29046/g.72889  ORF Transcript_29046/g.72889 Transcript_29046/m.72889 type:complete len:243 (+) Transcript_29046:3416-4144(+)
MELPRCSLQFAVQARYLCRCLRCLVLCFLHLRLQLTDASARLCQIARCVFRSRVGPPCTLQVAHQLVTLCACGFVCLAQREELAVLAQLAVALCELAVTLREGGLPRGLIPLAVGLLPVGLLPAPTQYYSLPLDAHTLRLCPLCLGARSSRVRCSRLRTRPVFLCLQASLAQLHAQCVQHILASRRAGRRGQGKVFARVCSFQARPLGVGVRGSQVRSTLVELPSRVACLAPSALCRSVRIC